MSSILRTNNKDSKKLLHQDLRVNETSRKCAWAVSCAAKALSPLSPLNSDAVDLVASGSSVEPGLFKRCLNKICCPFKKSPVTSSKGLSTNGVPSTSASIQKNQPTSSGGDELDSTGQTKQSRNSSAKKVGQQNSEEQAEVVENISGVSEQVFGMWDGARLFRTADIEQMGLMKLCMDALKFGISKENYQQLVEYKGDFPKGVERVYARVIGQGSGAVIIEKDGKIIEYVKVSSTQHATVPDCIDDISDASKNAFTALAIYNRLNNQPVISKIGEDLKTSGYGAVLSVGLICPDGTRHKDMMKDDDSQEMNGIFRGFEQALDDASNDLTTDPTYYPTVQVLKNLKVDGFDGDSYAEKTSKAIDKKRFKVLLESLAPPDEKVRRIQAVSRANQNVIGLLRPKIKPCERNK